MLDGVLVSSSPVRWIDIVARDEDGVLADLDAFDAVVSADHVERGKPAPDVYELATVGYAARTPSGHLSEADRVVSTRESLHEAVHEAVGLGA